jgi:PAS domain-containing protein
VNHAFCALYGYKMEEVIGLPSLVLRSMEFPDAEVSAIRNRVFNQRGSWQGVYRCVKKSGDSLDVECFVVPLDTSDNLPINGVFSLSWQAGQSYAGVHAAMAYLVNECFRLQALDPNALVSRAVVPKMGARQREVQRLVSLGYTTKEIAFAMEISPSTVNVVRWKLAQDSGKPKTRKTARKSK